MAISNEDYVSKFKNSSFEQVSMFNNGYFYTFYYDSTQKTHFVDKTPFIFCIGPAEQYTKKGKRIALQNVIAGLNLHHLPIKERYDLIKILESNYKLSEDSAHILSEETLNRLCPGVIAAVRYYNITRVYDLYKIKNSHVKYYLSEQGNILLSTPNEDSLRYEFNSEQFKTSDYS